MKTFFLIIIIYFSGIQILSSQSKIETFNDNKDAVVRIYSIGLPGAGVSYYYKTGSGFAVNDKGWIVTNNHVIDDAHGIFVVSHTDSEPDTSTAYVIWKDEKLDIAILMTENMKLPYLDIANNESVSQGDEILILGFPGSDLNDHEIKVTSGILSSSTKDSTLMTTAPINPGNSGGPAVNYKGEVVGQVYAKFVGLSVESTGFLRNNKYLVKAIDEASEAEIPLKKAIGTDNYQAYKKMVLADAEYIKIQDVADSLKEEQMQHVENAIDLINEALSLEPNYVIARYYLVNYLFRKTLLHCEMDTEQDEYKADRTIVEFNENWERAKNDSKGEEYHNKINNRIKNRIYSLADVDDIACYRWRDRVESYPNYVSARRNRSKEFQDYLYYGNTPRLLRESFVNPTWESDRYKKYDALVNEIPLAVTVKSYISLEGIFGSSDITTTVTDIEFEVEPINQLKILIGFGIGANQLNTDNFTRTNNSMYKSSEAMPIKLGLYAYDFRIRYNLTDVNNVLSRLWSLEYTTGMPGDAEGAVSSYSYLGLGEYMGSYDTDFTVNMGHALELFSSRVWLDMELLLGFGDIKDLYQFGLGLGYRY